MMEKMIFGLFLVTAAWQDMRKKSVSVWIFLAAGFFGIVFCLTGGRLGMNQALSCLVGAAILVLSYFSSGEIGAGDGLFFIVSGLFLNVGQNIKLLVYGVFLNGLVCAVIYCAGLLKRDRTGKKTVPFLPMLVPVWLGLLVR